jgi:hypothetical protein
MSESAFPGNSNKGKVDPQAKPKFEPVIQGEVVQKKKPIGRKFKELFFGGDFKDAGRYIVGDVLLPSARDMVFNAGARGLERLIYGLKIGQAPRGMITGPRTQYGGFINRADPRSAMLPHQPPHQAPQILGVRQRHDAGEFLVGSQEEAVTIVDNILAAIDQYGLVTVMDICDMLGLASGHVDNKWGWASPVGIGYRQTRNGFVVELPPADPIQ